MEIFMASISQNKKHRFNVFDFILIVLVIIIITVTTVKFIRSNPGIISGGGQNAVFTVTTVALPEMLKDQIKVGDSIYDTESSQLLGKVTAVQSDIYKLSGINEATGATVTTDVEGKIVLTLTVEAPVWFENGTYNIDGYRISVGKAVSVRTDSVSVSGECTALTITEKTS